MQEQNNKVYWGLDGKAGEDYSHPCWFVDCPNGFELCRSEEEARQRAEQLSRDYGWTLAQ